MPKRLTQKEVETILAAHSFTLRRQKGSHRIFSTPDGRMVTVPAHGKALAPGTLASIIRQSGLPRGLFR